MEVLRDILHRMSIIARMAPVRDRDISAYFPLPLLADYLNCRGLGCRVAALATVFIWVARQRAGASRLRTRGQSASQGHHANGRVRRTTPCRAEPRRAAAARV